MPLYLEATDVSGQLFLRVGELQTKTASNSLDIVFFFASIKPTVKFKG